MRTEKVKNTNGEVSVGHCENHPEDGVRVETSRGLEGVGVWLVPTEARALAALLLKHADRAEGKTP